VVRARITIVLCTLVLAALMIEIGLRVWRPIPEDQLLPFPYNEDRVKRIANGDVTLGFDHDLGWIPTPDRVRRDDDVVYRHNHEGLRADREYALDPPTGLQRIAAFGDSFTYCAEVSRDDCWVTRLERSWPQTEIMNFGVTGYGPDQAWLRYQRDGLPYRPCAVLIGYFSEDIDRVVNRFRPFIDPADSVLLSKPRFLLQGDGLELLPNPTTDPLQLRDPHDVEETLGDHDAWYYPDTFVDGPLDELQLVRVARTAGYRMSRAAIVRSDDGYPFYDQQGEAYQITGRILIAFAEQVRANGAAPIVVVFPGLRDLRVVENGPPPYRALLAWLERAGVPTVDLTGPLADAADQRGIARLFGDGHYSPAGNQIVSEYLGRTLPPLVAPGCRPG
jgi:hypothetical protein